MNGTESVFGAFYNGLAVFLGDFVTTSHGINGEVTAIEVDYDNLKYTRLTIAVSRTVTVPVYIFRVESAQEKTE